MGILRTQRHLKLLPTLLPNAPAATWVCLPRSPGHGVSLYQALCSSVLCSKHFNTFLFIDLTGRGGREEERKGRVSIRCWPEMWLGARNSIWVSHTGTTGTRTQALEPAPAASHDAHGQEAGVRSRAGAQNPCTLDVECLPLTGWTEMLERVRQKAGGSHLDELDGTDWQPLHAHILSSGTTAPPPGNRQDCTLLQD